MPHEQLDEKQAAAYLHMDARELIKLASRGQIPCRKVGGKFCFLKSDVDHWVEVRMGTLERARLKGIEKGVSRHHGFDDEALLVVPMIPDGGVLVPMDARTRDAAIRGLVAMAEASGLVYSRDKLMDEIRAREDLCSTALAPGVAMPHPRRPLPNDIAASFVVAGLTPNGIPYGAPDGGLTRLFFLICCKDDRTHLHVLARLAGMLHKKSDIDEILSLGDTKSFRDALLRMERAAII